MNKLYFNLTRILNGWVLNYCPYKADSVLWGEPQEKYFQTLMEVYEFISAHTNEVKKFDSASMRHLFKK